MHSDIIHDWGMLRCKCQWGCGAQVATALA